MGTAASDGDVMRKLVLYIATSLDGYIARSSGAVDWSYTDQDYGYTEFLGGIDTVLMGRKTYAQLEGFGPYPYSGRRGFVFSRTPRQPTADVTFVPDDLAPFVSGLKGGTGKDIWLVGGGDVVAECVRHDLIDEFLLFTHPIILGSGIPLFASGLPDQPQRLVGAKTYDSGLLQINYRREH
jgi:dihydrofolate reductase